MVTASTNK